VIRALRHRNFQLFFGGQLVSLTGTWMQSVAQAWLVYRLTGSAALLGLVSFASQFPVFVLAPFGGAAADDHWPRHPVVVGTQTASMVLAGILAALTLTDRVAVWHIFALSALLGVVNAFDIPARQALIFELVGRDDLLNAIALNSSMVNGARLLGPAVAGVLVAVAGEGWCFLINAVSFLAVIAGLLLMRVPRRVEPAAPGSAFKRIAEGFAYAGRTPPVRSLLLLMGLTGCGAG
jgi:MFS family permease